MRGNLSASSVVRELQKRLPDNWEATWVESPERSRPDITIRLGAPDGKTATLQCEVKASVTPRDVPSIANRLAVYADNDSTQGVLVAPYLSVNVRDMLADAGLGYLDMAGSLRVSIARPGLYMWERGPDRDPWRGPGRPRGSLRGEPAARVVRALVDFGAPVTARELVETSGASTGATYRVIEYLEDQGLVNRDSNRRVILEDWPGLLRQWARDYQFVKTNSTTRWLAPRGLGVLLKSASLTEEMDYAVTGSLAASVWAPYADAKLAMLYVEDANRAANEWGLRSVDAGANVLLAEPRYRVVFQRTRQFDLLDSNARVASPSQVVVDLLSGPGRNPSEGEALIQWMMNNERSWRL